MGLLSLVIITIVGINDAFSLLERESNMYFKNNDNWDEIDILKDFNTIKKCLTYKNSKSCWCKNVNDNALYECYGNVNNNDAVDAAYDDYYNYYGNDYYDYSQYMESRNFINALNQKAANHHVFNKFRTKMGSIVDEMAKKLHIPDENHLLKALRMAIAVADHERTPLSYPFKEEDVAKCKEIKTDPNIGDWSKISEDAYQAFLKWSTTEFKDHDKEKHWQEEWGKVLNLHKQEPHDDYPWVDAPVLHCAVKLEKTDRNGKKAEKKDLEDLKKKIHNLLAAFPQELKNIIQHKQGK